MAADAAAARRSVLLPRLWPAVFTLGWLLAAISAAEALHALFAVAVGDGEGFAFAASAAVTGFTAGACILTTSGRPFQLNFRDAAILTVGAWFIVPFFAALPFVLPPVDLSYIDAYFEMVSGFTTTGSTVMDALDTRPPTILLWRSTVQWIGGMGIIGLAILILPFLKIGGMQLFRLESSDRSENVLPRVQSVAIAIIQIYVTLTIACFIAYWLLGMTPFDALNHALTTVCTGGFSTHDSSFGYFTDYRLEWTAVLFMTAGSLPFLAYLKVVRAGSWRDRIEPQIVWFVGIILVSSLVLTLWLMRNGQTDIVFAFTKAVFNVTSVVSTTGFASTDYMQWGQFAIGVFFVLTFVGGCTGSTSGGIKILRFNILFSMIVQQAKQAIYPRRVVPTRYGTRVVSNEQIASVGAFVFLYLSTFVVFSMLLALSGLDTATALSSAA
ncbi:MAG: TrkH family potassium uptake protein, partial [Bauldia sp.]|nr:TrkH family potassium uptake protein [Bauldia sp.]